MADLIERDAAMRTLAIFAEVKEDLDYYRKLFMEIPAVNRWIPCSERFPSDSSYVLCSGRDGMGILRYVGEKWLDENGIAYSWLDENGLSYSVNEITHWMPLPEPPEIEVEQWESF